jgi:hypothetical protein
MINFKETDVLQAMFFVLRKVLHHSEDSSPLEGVPYQEGTFSHWVISATFPIFSHLLHPSTSSPSLSRPFLTLNDYIKFILTKMFRNINKTGIIQFFSEGKFSCH